MDRVSGLECTMESVVCGGARVTRTRVTFEISTRSTSETGNDRVTTREERNANERRCTLGRRQVRARGAARARRRARERRLVAKFQISRNFKVVYTRPLFVRGLFSSSSNRFPDLRGCSSDNLLYVKEDLFIPHHYTFYDLIVTKARGKSGPLFNFDVHDDVRMRGDARVEKDESHPGKIVQ